MSASAFDDAGVVPFLATPLHDEATFPGEDLTRPLRIAA
jgi:hypothetical protein